MARASAICSLAALSLVSACAREARSPSMVLITVDTLRADHLGCYGYFDDTSPTIDGLAASSLLFERAIATAAVTLPSLLSILSSTYPSRHGVESNLRFFRRRASDSLPFAAELLRTAGYRTAAFTSSAPVGAETGISVGFEVFSGPPAWTPERGGGEVRAANTIDQALAWLEEVDPPYFLWVHLFDPHFPYAPPPRFARPAEEVRAEVDDRLVRLAVPLRHRARARRAIRSYDGEIRYVDDQLRRLLAKLEQRDHYADSLIIFTADHGEGLYQHGWRGHELL